MQHEVKMNTKFVQKNKILTIISISFQPSTLSNHILNYCQAYIYIYIYNKRCEKILREKMSTFCIIILYLTSVEE